MDEIMNQNSNDLMAVTEEMLMDVRTEISKPETMRVPIGQLAALGGGIAGLCPALRTVTQTTSFPVDGLYRWVNARPGDALKVAKDGNFWGAAKGIDGTSKFSKFQQVTGISGTSTAMMPIDPMTLMVAAALFSIEKELGNIAETSRQILSFLEQDKKAKIRGSVETLQYIMDKYKFGWDNQRFVDDNHRLVLDIQKEARADMGFYQEQVCEILDSKKRPVLQTKVQAVMCDLQTKFKYYRLSLYTYSLASLLEIMLSKNFKEGYISGIREDIDERSLKYREIYSECSAFLEKKSQSTLDKNVLKGAGATSRAVGKLIGSIPLVKEGQVDEFLQDRGEKIKEKAEDLGQDTLAEFARISNPGTGIFMEKMEDLTRIYNHTESICFDRDNIYLIAG